MIALDPSLSATVDGIGPPLTGTVNGDSQGIRPRAPVRTRTCSPRRCMHSNHSLSDVPVISSKAPAAWEEEDWIKFTIGGHSFRKVKECARCTVPGRDQQTGEFHFKGGSFDGVKGKLLTAQTTLMKAFPVKAADPEWASCMPLCFSPIFYVHNIVVKE